MNSKIELVNELLSKWNPFYVPEEIAKSEYVGYVPIILENMVNEENLFDCLENILINKLGLEFNRSNNIRTKDLKRLCKELMAIK